MPTYGGSSKRTPGAYGSVPRYAGSGPRAQPGRTSLPGLPRGPRGPVLGVLTLDAAATVPRQAPRDEPVQVEHGFPAPPGGWADSDAEWAIYWAHSVLGRGQPGDVWFYRTPLFGEIWATGFVPDFLETDVRVALDVMGPGDSDRQQTIWLREAVLAGQGFQYVVIPDDVALVNPITALRDALVGISHSPYQ